MHMPNLQFAEAAGSALYDKNINLFRNAVKKEYSAYFYKLLPTAAYPLSMFFLHSPFAFERYNLRILLVLESIAR